MATNPYFNLHGSQANFNLLDRMTIESIKMHGLDMYYLPREIVNEDYFYTEDRFARFRENYPIELMIENVDRFGGDGDFLSKFGLQMQDQAVFIMSRTRFQQAVPTLKRPREGDLIYLPLTDGLFEIMSVEHEDPFYQHGRLYVYKLTCELFRYSQEQLDTGIDPVDGVEERLKNDNDASRDRFAKNDQIGEEAKNFIDFDQDNPFGDL